MRCSRSSFGLAQGLSTAHRLGVIYNFQNATTKNNSVMIIAMGLKNSSCVNVLIQAPPIPSARSTSGPTQQSEATMAAAMAPMSVPFPQFNFFISDLFWMLMTEKSGTTHPADVFRNHLPAFLRPLPTVSIHEFFHQFLAISAALFV